jgi:hypothetical protein
MKEKTIYNSFKGAGEPGVPPPPKPNSNPIKAVHLMWAIGIILQVICICLASLVFQGEKLLQAVISSLCAGAATAVVEWMYEVVADVNGNWFNYGGHTKLGKINFHMPYEIIIIFLCITPGLLYLSYAPVLSRAWGTTLWPFKDASLDVWLYNPVMLLIVAAIGSMNDFTTNKFFGLWMNGPKYTYWQLFLTCWFPCCITTVVVGRILFELPFAMLGIGVLVLLICAVVGIGLFAVVYMRKHRDILSKI